MFKTSLLAAAAVLALAACAGHTGTEASTAAAAPTAAAPPPEPTPAPSTTPSTTPAAPATYTDAQLRSFAMAARQIQPLNAQLTSGTPQQRTAAAAQVRTILQQNNLDSATYNAIAAQAQSDPAFAARISALAPGQ